MFTSFFDLERIGLFLGYAIEVITVGISLVFAILVLRFLCMLFVGKRFATVATALVLVFFGLMVLFVMGLSKQFS